VTPWFWALPVSALLWALSLPNFFGDGWGFLAWFALVPIFLFLRSSSPWRSALAGAFFSLLLLLTTQFWLFHFSSVAFTVVAAVEIPEYALVFLTLGWVEKAFPRWAPWLGAVVWTAFEFLRTQGFLGYPYASLASSQWLYPLILQTGDFAGPWLVTFWMASFAAWLARWIAALPSREFKSLRLPSLVWLGMTLLLTLWGVSSWRFWTQQELTDPKWSFALVQHVQDPWKGGFEAYAEGFDKLVALTDKAEAHDPAQTVVWSETAFVPSVFYHLKYRDDLDDVQLVLRLQNWLSTRKESFLIGNDHRELVYNSEGRQVLRDWNAVLDWKDGWKGVYKKRRLVPFTETFPFKKQFPWIFKWLKDNDTHFWEPGKHANVLDVGGLAVGTPVCFEDAFGETCRPFVRNGARALVNLTDDSWSGSVVPMRLHLALAVWRAVENRVPLLVCANGGTTAAVRLDGELQARLPEFVPGVLKVTVPVAPAGSKTLFTLWGDWWGWLMVGVVVLAFLGSFLRRFWRKNPKNLI
jgi:apolipoprotein N-acyltransferase